MAAVRLDNVLKRAEEFEHMDKAPAALDVLYETVSSKRTRAMPLDQLEPVFEKFIQLAVQLRRGKVVKDGLHQYKKLVMQSNDQDQGVTALVSAVNQLLELATAKVEDAQKQAHEVKVETEDLDEQTPQDLLLAMVSSDEASDRTDREVVTPWLKFLWESFRGVLDVLRNNSKLEASYAASAKHAFDFCLKYERKTEFRRLCELLRTHLQYAATQSRAFHKEYAAARQRAIEQADTPDVTHEQVMRQMPALNVAQNPIDLSDVDTLQRFLDTRFEQLDIAVKLELWQEAFRSVEDVHTLLTASRKPVAVESMAAYYETLARVFAVSQNHLFHAATYLRYFAMLVARRAPEAELQRVAGFTVLGLLCVPRQVGASQTLPNNRARRWMALINLSRCPTRQSLIEAALQRNLLAHAAPEVRRLFNLLETEFNPLTFKGELAEIAPQLAKPEFSIYAQPLLEVAATAVFDDLATTYAEAKLDFVLSLVSFAAPLNAAPRELERLLVRGSAQQGYRVRIDHQQNIVRFVDSLSYPLEGTAGSMVREELYQFAKDLARPAAVGSSAAAAVAAATAAASTEDASTIRRAALLSENREFLERKDRENRREEARIAEKTRNDKEAQAERARHAAEEKRAQEERAALEERQRQEKQFAKQVAEAELAEKRKLAESINAKGHVHVDMDKLETLSKEELNRMQIDQLDHEAKSLSARMASVNRRYDHLERALRREEAKLWQEDAATQRTKDEERHKLRGEALRQGAKRSHELAIAYSERFARVGPFYAAFADKEKSKFDAHISEKRAKNQELLEAAKAKRKQEVEERRKKEEEQRAQEEERRREQEKLAEERRKQDEERRKQEEERRKTVYQPPSTMRTGSPGVGGGSPFGAAAPGRPAGSPFGAAGGRPAGSPFGAAAGKPPANVAAPRPSGSPFGAATGKPPANVAAPRPSGSPFGAATGKPPANVTAPRSSGSPFGAAAGKPANVDAPTGGAYKPPSSDKPGRYVPPSLRK